MSVQSWSSNTLYVICIAQVAPHPPKTKQKRKKEKNKNSFITSRILIMKP